MPTTRRSFLRHTLVGAAALGSLPAGSRTRRRPESRLRVGIIGTGLRGQNHLSVLLKRADAVVTAIADIDAGMIEAALQLCREAGATAPTVYRDGPRDYRNLLAKEDLDAILIATPWRWHTEMAVASMEAGRYTGVEVSGAHSLEECWELVRAHERTGSHLFFLENVCYRRDVMAVLNMIRQGLFGELIHLEGGYQHDLRAVKFNDGKQPYGGGVEFGENAYSEARWRTAHSVHRNGDLYPTHGVGPIANYVNINRGNRFLGLSSVASKARGLHDYVVSHPSGGPEHPSAKVGFRLGDKVTTMLTTANGETVVLHHDTNLPRPYSLGFRVQGTKGLWMDVNKSIHLEGRTAAHQWESAGAWLERYDHPDWQRDGQLATGAGHGGMDWFLLADFVKNAAARVPAPLDAYDAATWMAITPLSERSVAEGGSLQAFPDFTRGRWMERAPVFG